MLEPSPSAERSQLRDKITSWIKPRVNEDAFKWLLEKSSRLQNEGEDWELFSSFSAVPRYLRKDEVNLSEDEQAAAQRISTRMESRLLDG